MVSRRGTRSRINSVPEEEGREEGVVVSHSPPMSVDLLSILFKAINKVVLDCNRKLPDATSAQSLGNPTKVHDVACGLESGLPVNGT